MFDPINKKGFTLIELIVVISIISLISSVLLVGFSSIRARTRDKQRLTQLKSFQTALELYHNDQKSYPPNATSNTSWTTSALWQSNIQTLLVNNGYLPSVPVDPRNVANCNGAADCIYKYYRYVTTTTTITCNGVALHLYEYVITFTLEQADSSVYSTVGDSNVNKCIPGARK